MARHEFGHGDIDKGFKEADIIVERSFKTEATHQGYIEPHACVASVSPDGTADMWVCTQGHYNVRAVCATMLGLDASKLRVTASEIGGGFGGKTMLFIEPVCLALSRKANRPVKMVMTRDEVFRASGPTASSSIWLKIGAKKDGRITAAHSIIKFQGGPFGGSLVDMGAMVCFACYDLPNVKTEGYDVICNRPRSAAYRAPSAPMVTFATECVLQEIADKLGLDAVDIRLMNAAKEGTKSSYGPTYGPIGLYATLEATKSHPHWKAPKPGKHQGRGVACGFWFNFGGNTCSTLSINADGSVTLSYGNPDIGGSRASMSLMVAEELGVPYEKVRAIIADTASLGFSDVTDGSRVTFAAGIASIEAARAAIKVMCTRAARMWGIPEDAVVWEKGMAKPAGDNAGKFEPLSMKEIAAKAERLPPGHGLEQGKLYSTCKRLNVPFVFATNGHLFVEFDRTTGLTSSPAPLTAFPSPDELRSRYEKALGFELTDQAARPLRPRAARPALQRLGHLPQASRAQVASERGGDRPPGGERRTFAGRSRRVGGSGRPPGGDHLLARAGRERGRGGPVPGVSEGVRASGSRRRARASPGPLGGTAGLLADCHRRRPRRLHSSCFEEKKGVEFGDLSPYGPTLEKE